jgi:hypothetical protein
MLVLSGGKPAKTAQAEGAPPGDGGLHAGYIADVPERLLVRNSPWPG